jgi:hypothetical protein
MEVSKPTRKKKVKRKKLSKLSTLIHKADKVVAKFIRSRDPFCVTCGKPTQHAGHYIRRGHKRVRWNVKNIHGQCCGCNTFLDGNMDRYALFMIEKYGLEHLQWLNDQKGTYKPTREELGKIIQAYE